MAPTNTLEKRSANAENAALVGWGVEQVNLIDQLLREQQELSAVERFSQKHEQTVGHLQQPHYEDLIPIRKPSTGEQYAFEVDLDKCTGCKACVVACHSMNGLHDNESWRDVGSITGMIDGTPVKQTVTSACHHCADPGCLSGCPVGAYEKEDNGIVRHLDDQCIGCQYCSLKCPYDVPKYDKSLGIVRKCDMCHDRLEEGEAPACVQSCPNGAIKIRLVELGEIREGAQGGRSMIPGAYRSDYTLPSTKFISRRRVLNERMKASDEHDLQPAHAHTPLVWMLMLTQVAVGLSLVDLMGRFLAPEQFAGIHMLLLIAAVVLGKVGLVASFLHLGSPLGAWRAFLGLKTSWLSREVVMFGVWMPALMLATVCSAWPNIGKWVPFALPEWAGVASAGMTVLLGLASVLCSVMVYVDTKRDFWVMWKTLSRFGGTLLVGGFGGLFAVELIVIGSAGAFAVTGFILSLALKLGAELRLLAPAWQKEWSYAKKSALLQLKPLKTLLTLRWCALVAAISVGVVASMSPLYSGAFGVTAFMLLLVGEWLERRLFFQAVVTLKMPGEINRAH
ncbi:hypothetical protein Rhal01_00921 [Rubritalea halochordaticola]|uniref:4Fe-4S ferredoxin-type domain-containing protein n=1 Tax=Rubritalea halochordaticola TaxID=714537 RepID=A0ABP9UWK2_9BACT